MDGLAHGLSKSILKTPHRQINNIKNFHYRGTLTNLMASNDIFIVQLTERCRVINLYDHDFTLPDTLTRADELKDLLLTISRVIAELNGAPEI